MNSVAHSIAGLPLPHELVKVIQDGKWRPPNDPQVYIDTFGEPPDNAVFYDLDEMSRQDPARSVLIGDLGPDMPIALDFRNSASRTSKIIR